MLQLEPQSDDKQLPPEKKRCTSSSVVLCTATCVLYVPLSVMWKCMHARVLVLV